MKKPIPTEKQQPLDDSAKPKSLGDHLMSWLLFPLALFPLVALMSYDWRAIEGLRSPVEKSSNWIGALGDFFAYWGYVLFGMAIWIVPIACVLAGICCIAGRRMKAGRRIAWFFVFLIACACLVQVAEPNAPGIHSFRIKTNFEQAGGVFGFLIMTKFLMPLLSPFGSTVLIVILLIASLAAAIGMHNLISLAQTIIGWAMGPGARLGKPGEEASEEEKAAYNAALAAREEARRQKEEEKARAKEEKLRAKEALKEAKAAKKREIEEARLRMEQARQDRKDKYAAQVEAIRKAREAARAGREEELNGAAASQPNNQSAKSSRYEENEEAPQPHNDKGPYVLPDISLLNPIPKSAADHGNVEEVAKRLIDTLKLFGVDAKMSYTVQGPVVTKYAIELAPGTRYSSVTNIEKNLMGAMHARSLRIEAPIPGEDRVGIEVPNKKPISITFREIIESDAWKKSKAELPLLFGKNAAGKELVSDLATMPHMLVAGATGQGKSVCLNSIINGLLMTRTPEELKLIMVDPKSVEFTPYASIPHLLVPVITDNRKVVFALHWAVAEMEKRLKLFAREKVRNIYDFNHRKSVTQTDMFRSVSDEELSDVPKTVPYIVIIIDEVADLMATAAKEVTPDISRLTAKARAAGIHLILATQRPDAKVITGTIKANIPGRVAFKTAQGIDSRTILDDTGAENLIGRGDMLFKSKDGLLIRAQGAWIADEEIERITKFIEEHSDTQFDEKFATKLGRVKEQAIDDPFSSNPDDPDNLPQDDNTSSPRETVKTNESASLYKKAIEVIINTNRASVSHFQRRLGIGYNNAARLCDQLEENGVIAPQSGAGPRTILLDQQQLIAIMNGENIQNAGEQDAFAGDEELDDPAQILQPVEEPSFYEETNR